jgi:hypothetical protein
MREPRIVLKTTIIPCLIALIIVSATMTGCNKTSSPSPSPASETLVYENSEYGFSVEYPAGWAYEEGVKDTVVIFGSPFLDQNKIRITINITAEDVPESNAADLTDFAEMSEIGLQGAVENYNKTDEREITVCDRPAIFRSYTFTYQGRTLMQSQVYFLNDTVAYTITYTASPASHQDNTHFLDTMLSSFECE